MTLKVPPEPEVVGWQHSRYNGREFYGQHADERAELTYLRDWKRWAEQELRIREELLRRLAAESL